MANPAAGEVIFQWGAQRTRVLPPHLNPGLEIVYIARGRLEWSVEGRVETVMPRTAFFTLPWQEHGSTRDHEPGNELYYVIYTMTSTEPPADGVLRFPAALGLSREEAATISRILLAAPRHGYPAPAALAGLVPALVRELDGDRPLRGAMVGALARACLIELARTIAADPSPPYDPASRRVDRFLRALGEDPGEPWTLASMAAACGLRRSQFSTIVARLTGESPMAHLQNLRLARARHLLEHSDGSITRIAHECGFGTSQYFARLFRRAEGMAAAEWRRRRRAG